MEEDFEPGGSFMSHPMVQGIVSYLKTTGLSEKEAELAFSKKFAKIAKGAGYFQQSEGKYVFPTNTVLVATSTA